MELELRENGGLVVDGLAIGRVEDSHLILNLGWMKLAGVGLTVQGDPDIDHKRGGVVLQR